MACINQDFNFIHGDTETFYFSIPKIGVPITQIYYTVKKAQNDKPLLQKKIGSGIDLVSSDSTKHHYMITFTNGCTDCLKSNVEYMHDIEVIYGTTKKTLLKGKLKLDEEVTTTKCEC